MSVVPLRRFKVPQPAESQFFKLDDSQNRKFMEEDLAKSGLTPEDIQAYTTPLLRKDGALAAYGIPYFDLDGNPITDKELYPVMYRARFKYPEFSKEQRYTQPSKEQLEKNNLPTFIPYIHPLTLKLEGDSLVCCEGEKKTAAVLHRLGLPAFGIGGCQMWRNPDGSGSIHPWIRKLIQKRGTKEVIIVPDADVFRYDICNAYGTFAHALLAEGIAVSIVRPEDKIDDLLVRWGQDATSNFSNLQRIEPNQLVQSASSLVKRYDLAFKQSDKGTVTVYQHTSNVMRLMENHDAFPRVWRNQDNNKIMVGEVAATPDLTEMDIANYFQHNLGFDKVTSKGIYACIQALGKRNAKSPFLEYVRNTQWDGKPRLETWLQDFWGLGDSPFVREVGSKWLISACARMDKPGTKIDWIFIVIGPQGTGKTSMPGILFKDASLTLYGEQNDKDFHMLLHSALCIGFDELDSFGKRESSNLKAMITRNEDAFRPPYGASVEVFPRRFTLYGCGNRHEFLQHDPSGYRRYAIVEVGSLLDFSGLEAVRDQLWAEAWQRYTQGDIKFWEVEGASKEAENFVTPNVIEEQIVSWIESQKHSKSSSAVKDGVFYFTMTHLLSGIGCEQNARNTNFTREVSAILKGLGADRRSARPPWGGGAIKLYTLPI